ncbi:MAG TPA: hypothetical protein VNJ07_00665 [Chitinophagales bacterium]|nr:hypothetical protein [Chitinophagales bacterium]
MKNVLAIFVLGLMTSLSFAQTNNQPTAANGQFVSWQNEEDNDYLRSRAFIRQVGITQITCGSIMLPAGLTLIGFGTHKVNHPDINVTPEGDAVENLSHRRNGMIMIATGTITSVAGAILIMRGTDTLKKIRNKQGEVISELTLPKSGAGLAVRF